MKIALIADIHEDINNLTAALKMIEREKCDEIYCLGDILGYPYLRGCYENQRDAKGCLSIIRSCCSVVLPGNHDIFHIKKIPEFHSQFQFPDNWRELSPEKQMMFSQNRIWDYSDDYPLNLSEDEINFLLSIPEFLIKEFSQNGQAKKILFAHSLYPDFTAYLSTNNSDRIKLQDHFSFLRDNSIDMSFCGHMHMEGVGIGYETGGKIISTIFPGFRFYSYGVKRLKIDRSCVTIPAIADNGQENGFAILNIDDYSVNSLSLNINRRLIL